MLISSPSQPRVLHGGLAECLLAISVEREFKKQKEREWKRKECV